METETILIIFAVLGFGIVGGYYLRYIISLARRRSMDLEIKEMLLSAREQATRILEHAELTADTRLQEVKNEEKQKRELYEKTEERLLRRETLLEERNADLEREIAELKIKSEKVEAFQEEAELILEERRMLLETAVGMSMEEMREELMHTAEEEYADDINNRLRKLELFGEEKLQNRVQDILASSIQRLASSTAQELTTTVIEISSEDIKGKIIGKEGRNIRTFERMAGVELIVDDAPGSIIISSFDPVRRHIAKVALEKLIADGRIQPAKIEEFLEKAKEEIHDIIKKKGEEAVYECGIVNFDPRLIAIIGRLHFRTSYGQNVLRHSIEMTHIAGMLAAELGADVSIAKAGALVHDIGKALDHEIEGTHVNIGIRILQKFGADPRVITAMKSHHDEYPYESVEAIIVQTADAISGARPGARRDTAENYLRRLNDLEQLATTFSGVDKTYAIQAGREIRVFVTPDKISDLEARQMARDIAIRIEKELRYPGEIKVTVIRETRIVDYAR